MSQPLVCDSRGAADLCTSLLHSGYYVDSILEIPPLSPYEGVVLLAPSADTDCSLWTRLQACVAASGYRIARAKVLSGRDIQEQGLARAYFQVELDIAAAGGLDASQWVRLLQIYDCAQFRSTYGVTPIQVRVVPALGMLISSGKSALDFKHWCRAKISEHGFHSARTDALNAIGDGKVICLFQRPDRPPVFVLNPHVFALLAEYEEPDSKTCAFHLRPARSDCCAWQDVVANVLDGCGAGCRVSRGPADAVHDLCAWFDIVPQYTTVGVEMTRDTPWQPLHLVTRPYFDYLGERRVFREVASGLAVEQSRELLMAGQLVEAPGTGASKETRRRVELAFEEANILARDPRVICVMATGSVARDRCSHDSDLDLAVIFDNESGSRRIDSCQRDGFSVDRDWIPQSEALAIVSDSSADIKTLRESSRLGFGLVMYDRDQLSQTLRQASRSQLPARADVQRRLSGALLTLSHAIDNYRQDASQAWEALRSIYDNVVLVALLLHPLRYQKAKWVVKDLSYVGNDLLLQGLLDAYSVGGSFRRARRIIETSRQFLSQLADSLQLPSYEETLAMGYAPQYAEFSYACRCHADASSLLVDELFADAEYTAKFAVRLGIGLFRQDQFPADDDEQATNSFPLEVLERHGNERLIANYRSLFDVDRRAAPEDDVFRNCYEAADACRRFYRSKYRLDE